MVRHQVWEQYYATESENLALRESVAELHEELAQLRLWKAQALELMTAWGPKRLKLQKEKDETLKLKKKLLDMEQQVLERVALSEMLAELKVQDAQLIDKLTKTQRENDQWKAKLATESAAHLQTRRQLSFMEDTFEKLVDQLLVVRQQFDTTQTDVASKQATRGPVKLTEGESPSAFQERTLIAGMYSIGEACVQWVGQRLRADATELSSREGLESGWTNEKARLEQEMARLSQQVLDGDATRAKQEHDLRLLQGDAARAELVLLAARQDVVRSTQHTMEGKAIMKRLLRDVRQYLHLTQLEVKKKFGYVPDAITHHVVWENISTSMKEFDQFLVEAIS